MPAVGPAATFLLRARDWHCRRYGRRCRAAGPQRHRTRADGSVGPATSRGYSFGRSSVDLTVHRRPASAKGRLLTVLLALFGRRIFGADLAKTLTILASDHGAAPAPDRPPLR